LIAHIWLTILGMKITWKALNTVGPFNVPQFGVFPVLHSVSGSPSQ
jgi:hypothetical protein